MLSRRCGKGEAIIFGTMDVATRVRSLLRGPDLRHAVTFVSRMFAHRHRLSVRRVLDLGWPNSFEPKWGFSKPPRQERGPPKGTLKAFNSEIRNAGGRHTNNNKHTNSDATHTKAKSSKDAKRSQPSTAPPRHKTTNNVDANSINENSINQKHM